MIAGRRWQVLIGVALWCLCCEGTANAQTISVSPAQKHVLPGSSVTFDVRVDGVGDVHGASITLAFDNTIVSYTAIAQGGFLSSGGEMVFFGRNPAPGPTAGSVVVDQAVLGQGTVSGAGVLFAITLKGIKAGTTTVSISSGTLRDIDNNPLPCTFAAGQVVVGNPSIAYVNPAFTAGSAGGHEFGYDAFTGGGPALAAITAGGTVNFAASTYNESVTVGKNVAFTGAPAIQSVLVNSGATLDLQTDLQVDGTLTLDGGNITTGPHRVRVTSGLSSAVSVVTGAVIGSVERVLAGGSTGVFQFTDPQTLIVPSGSQGTITMTVTSYPNTLPPGLGGGSSVIRRYYTLTPSGSLSATVRLAYAESELNTIPEGNLLMFRLTGVSWAAMGGIVNTTGNYAELAGVSSFGTLWTLGDVDHPVPIQLAELSATMVDGTSVLVAWKTLSEINNFGFYVEKRRDGEADFTLIPGSFQAGHGTTTQEWRYAFTDASTGSGRCEYRLRQIDQDNTIHFTPAVWVTVTTDVRPVTPAAFQLTQNYPNPFNPSTQISFSVESTSPTTLLVFDLQGRQVGSLFEGTAEAGRIYSLRFSASHLASGTYIYRLQSGTSTIAKKLLLVR